MIVFVLFGCYSDGYYEAVEVSQSREYLKERVKYYESLLAYSGVKFSVLACETFSEV